LLLQDAVLQNGTRCAAFAAEFTVYEDLWNRDMKESLSAWLKDKTSKNEGAGSCHQDLLRRICCAGPDVTAHAGVSCTLE
jgi:hypothetical protein